MFPICFEWGELPGGKFSVKETPREIIIKEDDRVLDILRCAFEPEIGVIGAGVYRAALAYMYEETGNIMSKPFALLDGCMSLCRAWGRYFGGIRAYE